MNLPEEVIATFAPLRAIADRELIDEIKRRGYRVVREERVRVLRTSEMPGNHFERSIPDDVKEKLVNGLWRRLDATLLRGLVEQDIIERSTRSGPEGVVYSAEIVAVLPKPKGAGK